MTPILFEVGVKAVNGLNHDGRHWGARAKRAKDHRKAVADMWKVCRCAPPPLPVVVTMTRFSPGTRPMDSDGLSAALKPIRDGVADCLGVDDADARITWNCRQERRADHCVRILIESTGG